MIAVTAMTATAGEPSYGLRLETSNESGQLTVTPLLTGPAGQTVRYEMRSSKSGSAGKSVTTQSGKAMLGADGTARLSTLSLGIRPQDRYEVVVTVFKGASLVAEQVLQYPR